MDIKPDISVLLHSKKRFEKIAQAHDFLDADVTVLVKTLTPEEAIGRPGRRDSTNWMRAGSGACS